MSVNQPATATQLNREADQEGYRVVADWLNSARLLNWVRDLQICINRFGFSVVSKCGMALLAQTVNPESNLMAGLEINGAVGPLIFLWLSHTVAPRRCLPGDCPNAFTKSVVMC